ncbi:hypothetical protein J4476_02430 [Candidatus Woesearchaeota archaeon]|nr:MAG: hypothetical protein QT09_C0011G0029 [archaeon GW2011_AR18]MBS3161526.1 hypothetical protein [Candidatus Woesearchaeota archaeon]HIH25310.1 hypothetical protein [Nanoarchaeota archaeon]
MKKIPKSLKKWFMIHFIIDYIFGIPLIIYPDYILKIFNWTTIDPVASRIVGAALIGIGSISFLERNGTRETYKALLKLKIIWSTLALVGILISIKESSKMLWFIFIIFLIFNIIWVYYYKIINSRE